MSQLLSHTPIWVFIIFFTLLILGVIQTKDRIVKVNTVFILPSAMILFSIFGIYSVFGFTIFPLLLWLVGGLLAFAIGLKLALPKLVGFSKEDNKLLIPGSKVPLILMMAIFFTKYFVGFSLARNLPLTNEFIFVVIISLTYGIFSGVFLSRSLVMFNARKIQ